MHPVLTSVTTSDLHGIFVLAAGTIVAALIVALVTLLSRFVFKLNRIIDRWFRVDPDNPEANLPGMVHQLARDVIPGLADQLGQLTDAVKALKDSHERQAGDIERVEDRLTRQDTVLARQDQQLARIVGGVKAVDEAVHEQSEDS